MNKLTSVCGSLVFLLGVSFAAGCGQSDQEISGVENRGQENAARYNDGKNNNPNELYTSSERRPEQATSIEESHQDMDVLTPGDPVMANAHSYTVEFNRGAVRLTTTEQESLSDFIDSLDKDKPAYITIRMEDADTLDVTEPAPEFKKLTPDRVNRVADFFKRGGLEIAELKVDEAGVIETPGEDRALAREPDNGNGQLVVITIDEIESDNEPSGTIPHSPAVETTRR